MRKEQSATIGVYDGEYCSSFAIELVLKCMGVPCRVFGDEDIPKPGFGEEFSVAVFGAGGVSESQTALGGSVGKEQTRPIRRIGPMGPVAIHERPRPRVPLPFLVFLAD